MAKILDGKKIAEEKISRIHNIVSKLDTNIFGVPTLTAITVGDDEASKVYIKNKRVDCEKCGFNFIETHFDDDIPESELIKYIKDLGSNTSVCLPHLAIANHSELDTLFKSNVTPSSFLWTIRIRFNSLISET